MNSRLWHELGPFTVFDLETTGMRAVSDRIVEIAAIRVDCDGAQSRFESLVNPGRPIPPAVSRIHHITDDMVGDAPKFSEIALDFMKFADGSTLVAHNARFDLSFLQESLARTGHRTWQGKTLDTLRMARQLYADLPGGHSLQNLRRTFSLDRADEMLAAHRAGADVEWTCRLLRMMIEAMLEKESR